MYKVKYYKDSHETVNAYAFKRMFNIFGVATPLERVAQYFNYTVEELQEWEALGFIPDAEEAVIIIESITKEKAEDFVTERNQAIDFIVNNIH